MNILQEMRLDIESQIEFLIANPDRIQIHWKNFIGVFNAVPGVLRECGCPVQLRSIISFNPKSGGGTTGIHKVDVILDGGDDQGNRIPNDSAVLFRRWSRAAGLPNPERVRRKILRPFLLIRKAVIEHERNAIE